MTTQNQEVAEEYQDALKGYVVDYRLEHARGGLNYCLSCFGDHLAKREKYKSLRRMEAIYFYLVQKYKWFPSQVRSLNNEEIRFLLKEEMYGWTLSKAQIEAEKKAVQELIKEKKF